MSSVITCFDGNFGINTTNPTQSLDVSGNIKIGGSLYAQNLPGTTGQLLSSTNTGLSWISPIPSTICILNMGGNGGTLNANSTTFNITGAGINMIQAILTSGTGLNYTTTNGTNSGCSLDTSNARFNISTTGRYLFVASVQLRSSLAAGTAYDVYGNVRINGSIGTAGPSRFGAVVFPTITGTGYTGGTLISNLILNAGDNVDFFCYSNTGSTVAGFLFTGTSIYLQRLQ